MPVVSKNNKMSTKKMASTKKIASTKKMTSTKKIASTKKMTSTKKIASKKKTKSNSILRSTYSNMIPVIKTTAGYCIYDKKMKIEMLASTESEVRRMHRQVVHFTNLLANSKPLVSLPPNKK